MNIGWKRSLKYVTILLYVLSFLYPISMHVQYATVEYASEQNPLQFESERVVTDAYPATKPDTNSLTVTLKIPQRNYFRREENAQVVNGKFPIEMSRITVKLGDFLPFRVVITNSTTGEVLTDLGVLEAINISYVVTIFTTVSSEGEESRLVAFLQGFIYLDNTTQQLEQTRSLYWTPERPSDAPLLSPTIKRGYVYGFTVLRTWFYENRTECATFSSGSGVSWEGSDCNNRTPVLLPSTRTYLIPSMVVVWPNASAVGFSYLVVVLVGVVVAIPVLLIRYRRPLASKLRQFSTR